MTQDTFSQSLWSAISPPGPELPRLLGEETADIVLVGAGFLGMNTALGLARAGLKVVLLEASEPGFGASGRNTGFVVPTLKKALSPSNVVARFGTRRGEAFNRMIGGSGERLFSLIRDNGIACDSEQTGWMQPAHSRAALAACATQVREWRARGFDVQLLDRGETEARTGMTGYHGAMLIPSGGQINPLAWARGLARLCLSEGVRIFAGSPVIRLARDGAGWRVHTPGGSVVAPRAVLTTNALVGKLCSRVDRAIIPTYSFQIATQKFDAEIQARLLPARSPIADSRRHLFAARWSSDGRIVGGGLVYPGPFRLARTRRRFEKRFARFLPQLGQVRAEYAWFGTVAVTLDALPRLFRLDRGLWAPIGCNGRGVALTAAYGHELAQFFAGNTAEEDFVVPVTQPEPIPMRAMATAGPYLWLPYSEYRDRIETEAPAE
ncbi:NAD(P)/FAD-dependent oxidoreductase [Sinirhodobacter huangdaonensis]|uniref:FAD-binding oxidoreductase n=1 Tax=Paenirhodobacter huangdaonensis TaxID=2501515 RepID=A0A3S3LH12_9RHOB|nr:FAD-dependent oxidoreductase [Sinirhodobacter huangdaonensis]RWR54702.1 FAD-binding oxidoreductase [Sinirhodobacter huangdaonensis]